MSRLIAALVIFAAAVLPLSAQAQQPATPPGMQGAPMTENRDFSKAMAIGAGIVIGAILGGSVTSLRGATIAGAVAGGLIGSWWYDQSMPAPALKAGKTSL